MSADFEEFTQPTVEAIWAAREAEAESKTKKTGFGISASKLGSPCDRDLFYSLRWATEPESFSGRTLRIFERGNIEEDRVLADLQRAGVHVLELDPATGKQWRISLLDGWIRGYADGLIEEGLLEAPRARHVIEIKSMKAADFRGIVKHGVKKHKHEHWQQLHTGMVALKCDRGAYIAVNKDTEEIWIERIEIDRTEWQRQEARVKRLVDHYAIPDRAASKADSFMCRFCSHKPICHDRALPDRNCRTCVHHKLTSNGALHCDKFDQVFSPYDQIDQRGCPHHLFLPTIIDADNATFDPENNRVEHEWTDGMTYVDGGPA